jgi:hypothetical protein
MEFPSHCPARAGLSGVAPLSMSEMAIRRLGACDAPDVGR